MPPGDNLGQTAAREGSGRLRSIDMLRGLVMVIMALDHVRELWSATPFRPEDLDQTSPGWFFARWITHLCAPTFVFLSGMSIWLRLQQRPNRTEMSRFLVIRGLWLIVVELFIVNPALQLGYSLILLQVIWVFGWSMMLMAGVIRLPVKVVGITAVLIIVLHDLLPSFQPITSAKVLVAMLHNSPGIYQLGSFPPLLIAYTIFPWAAVMMAGYAAASWLTHPGQGRRNSLIAGAGLVVLFICLRLVNYYGDPSPWAAQERGLVYSVLSFVNVTKYPASLQFLSLMIGLALVVMGVFFNSRTRVVEWLAVFGRVPFFFYVLHIPLISVAAFLWMQFSYGGFINLGFSSPDLWPEGYSPSLTRTYAVWACCIFLLFWPCRRFGAFRRTHIASRPWLSYL
jgi:uncharacterized membrane protein